MSTLERLGGLIASSPHNLVSRRERDAVFAVHITEAVALLSRLPVRPGERWLDLGTGGGLPGLALAILAPDVHWVLLDATAKKVHAVASFAETLGVANVAAIEGRAEERAHDREHRARYHGVVARAVAPLPSLVELARGFLRPQGVLAAVKGSAREAEVAAAAGAVRTLRYTDPIVSAVDDTVRPTWVVTMRAVGPPPAGFPRRTGTPRAHPLG